MTKVHKLTVKPAPPPASVRDSAKRLSDICQALRQLIEMSYDYEDGVCPAHLLETVFARADRLADQVNDYFEEFADLERTQ